MNKGTTATGRRPVERRSCHSGFTLMELITSLSILTILLLIAIPSLSHFSQTSGLSGAAHQWITSLQFGRSTAITQSTPVVFCPSINGQSCTLGTDWDEGWILFQDPNRSWSREVGEKVLLVGPAAPAGVFVGTGSNFEKGIAYLPNGMSLGEGGLSNGTFRYCNNQGKDQAYSVIVNKIGRVRTQRGSSSCP